MQRLLTSVCPGYVDAYDDEEKVQKCIALRQHYRQKLNSMGGDSGNFPPLPAPSLRASDKFALVDLFYDGKAIVCSVACFDFSSLSSLRKVASFGSGLEVEVGNDGCLELRVDECRFTGKVHLLRLTDLKVVCIHVLKAYNYVNYMDYDDCFLSDKIPVNGFCLRAGLNLWGDDFGTVPTLLTSRMGDKPDECISI